MVLLIAVVALSGFGQWAESEKLLLDFESEVDLDQIDWRCQTLFALSHEHVTHEVRSLRMELYPSDYPGLSPKLAIHDWRGYRALCFAVHNPEGEARTLSVRIDDRRDYPPFEDRFNGKFVLQPGRNFIRTPFGDLVTSGEGGRRLDPGGIHRLVIFVASPERKMVLLLDHMRLER